MKQAVTVPSARPGGGKFLGLWKSFLCSFLVLAAGILISSSVRAEISAGGDFSPNDSLLWRESTTLYIGNFGTGALSVTRGSVLRDESTYIGNFAGANGVVTVDGAGSELIDQTDLIVGNYGTGTVNITDGGTVTDTAPVWILAKIGNFVGSTGTVNVDGAGSTWSLDQSGVIVGNNGTGILNITNGGAVNNFVDYIASNSGSIGTVTVDGVGSALTSKCVQVGQAGTGTLNITNGGTVLAGSGGTSSTIGSLSGSIGIMNVLGTGSALINQAKLGIGYEGTGTLNITDGASVTANGVTIGEFRGAIGTVNIDGPSSTLTNTGVVDSPYGYGAVFGIGGNGGMGTLNITNGGSVINSPRAYINGGSTANIDGAGSTWTNYGSLLVGSYNGTATLNITDGGTVTNRQGYIGTADIVAPYNSAGIVNVDGAGSTWTNTEELFIGGTGTGTLNINNGGSVTASSVSISRLSTVTVDFGHGSELNVGSGMGTITNDGKIRLVAGAEAASGTYAPITAGTWRGAGNVQTLGGRWDATNHVVAVSDALAVAAGQETTIDLSTTQRVLVTDADSGSSVGAAFLGTNTPSNITFTAAMIDEIALLSLQELLDPEDTLLSGWEFYFEEGYTEGTPVYLSLFAGSDYELSDLSVWHYDEETSEWSVYAASDLSYDGAYANFTVTGFSGYAVTGPGVDNNSPVPEPSTMLLLGCGLIGLAGAARRKMKR